MDYIQKIETLETGGGETVDFIQLKDGRVVGINEGAVTLYESMQQYRDGERLDFMWLHGPWFSVRPEPVFSAYWGFGYGMPQVAEHPLSWFSDCKNYTRESRAMLAAADVGDKIDLSDMCGEHFVVRIS
jgi:hypothetical protein